MKLLYLAKPSYGGWVSFTAHLALIKQYDILKITQKGEKKPRNYGYGTWYRNCSLEHLLNSDEDYLITAVGKNFYQYLKYFEGHSIVIHDPTELKPEVLKALPLMNVFTIRKSVHELLLSKGIVNFFLYHPLYNFNIGDISTKEGAISISRIDFDKNIDLLIECNNNMESSNIIDIWGAPNDLYVYHRLKSSRFKDYYFGKFDKTFEALKEKLRNKKFLVDMSTIHKDGGGSQYTFLEAIKMKCCLILNKKWVEGGPSKFKHGVNCLIVENAEELRTILEQNPDVEKIVENSQELLKEHLSAEGW